MKPIILSVLSLFIVTFATAQKKETVKVWGNCGMCKKTIETAAKNAGAAEVDWNKDTKIMSVSFSGNTDMKKIEQAVAAAGYDTQNFTADNNAYNNLPECCQYTRKTANAGSSKMADCCKGGTCTKGEKGEKGCKDCEKCASCEKCKNGQCADCCKDGKCSEGKDCCKK